MGGGGVKVAIFSAQEVFLGVRIEVLVVHKRDHIFKFEILKIRYYNPIDYH